jgi:hypothetical protein
MVQTDSQILSDELAYCHRVSEYASAQALRHLDLADKSLFRTAFQFVALFGKPCKAT